MTGFFTGLAFGLLLAAAFDWWFVYRANPWKLETLKERRQAAVLAFAVHGPWMGLGVSLFLSGAAARLLGRLGVDPAVAGILSLPAFLAFGAAVIWVTQWLPPVRKARLAVREKMRKGPAANYGWLARSLMVTPHSPPTRGADTSEPK